jgi:hypothetical protein
MLQHVDTYTDQSLVAQDGAKELFWGNKRILCLRPDYLPMTWRGRQDQSRETSGQDSHGKD